MEGVFLTFAGKVEVAHRGLKKAMAHVLLDVADVNPGFEQVSGVAVTKGMNTDAVLINAELF